MKKIADYPNAGEAHRIRQFWHETLVPKINRVVEVWPKTLTLKINSQKNWANAGLYRAMVDSALLMDLGDIERFIDYAPLSVLKRFVQYFSLIASIAGIPVKPSIVKYSFTETDRYEVVTWFYNWVEVADNGNLIRLPPANCIGIQFEIAKQEAIERLAFPVSIDKVKFIDLD